MSPRRILGLFGVIAVLVTACSAGDERGGEAPEPHPVTDVIVDGTPGWVAAVDRPPVTDVESAAWTGAVLAVAHTSGAGGRPAVVAFDPERGDWLDRGLPFEDPTATDPVIGHDAQGRIVVVAACEPGPAADAAEAGMCPASGLLAGSLDRRTWHPVVLPDAGPDPEVRFVGPGPRGAAFDIGGRIFTITKEMAEAGDESGLVDAVGCRDRDGAFAISRPAAGVGAGVEIRWRADGGTWEPVAAPEVLAAAFAADPSGTVGPVCGRTGVSFARQDGSVTDLHSLAADGSEPRWRRCIMAGGSFDDVHAVRLADGRFFAVAHRGPEGTAEGETTVAECMGGQGSTISNFPGPRPVLVADAEPGIVIVATDPVLDVHVLAP